MCACCCWATVPRSWIGVTLRLRDFFPRFWIVVAELLRTHLKAVVVSIIFLFFFSCFPFFSTNKSLVVTYYRFLLFYVAVVPTYLLPGSRCKSAKVGSSSPVSRDSAARRKVLFINFIICLDFWRFPLISSPRYTLTMFLIGSDSCWHLQCRKNTYPPATLSSSTIGNLIRFPQKVCCDRHEVYDARLPFLLVLFRLLLGRNNRELGSMHPSYVLWTWMIYHFWNSCWKPAGLLTNAADFSWDGWSFARRRSYWIQEESWNSDRVETGDRRCLLTMCVLRWERKTFVVRMVERANRLLVNEMQSSSVHDLVSCIFQSLPHLSVLDRAFGERQKKLTVL